MLNLVADENMPAVERLFGDIANVRRLPGRSISPDDLAETDILLVRSITSVNERLLAQAAKLKFIGTATIGMDHLDQTLLHDNGVHVCNAPGCNADAVVDYTLSGILNDCAQRSRDLMGLTVGVVGCGSVGGRLIARLSALGIRFLSCDPLRANESDFVHSDIDELLQASDIICLHTPLTRQGEYPSYHLLNETRLSSLKPEALLINAGRGAVIDNQALLNISIKRQDLTLILDVWEHEPKVNRDLANRCFLATPHIAGYSLDGKLRGSWMLYQQLCQYLGIECSKPLTDILPPADVSRICVSQKADPLRLMQLVYDQWADDRRFRRSLDIDVEQQKLNFDRLRKTYPERREFSSLQVDVNTPEQFHFLKGLGFSATKSKIQAGG